MEGVCPGGRVAGGSVLGLGRGTVDGHVLLVGRGRGERGLGELRVGEAVCRTGVAGRVHGRVAEGEDGVGALGDRQRVRRVQGGQGGGRAHGLP